MSASGEGIGLAPVVALSGRTGSGKTSLGHRLSSELGLVRASFGDYVRAAASERGESDDRATLQSVGEQLIGDLGPLEFSRRVLTSSGWRTGSGLVVDGVRHITVLEALSSLVMPQRLRLIYLSVDAAHRLDRLAHRGAGETNLAKVDQHSTEVDVPVLASRADLVLSGEASVESLAHSVERFLIARG